MDSTTRRFTQQLLAENDAHEHNIAVLWGIVDLLQQIAALEGHAYDVPLTADLPPEVIQSTIHQLGARLQTLRNASSIAAHASSIVASAPPEPNGKRVPVGAGKESPS